LKKPHAILPYHGRHLSPEEIDLWLHATRAVQPRIGRQHRETPRRLAPPLSPAAQEPLAAPGLFEKPPATRLPPLAPLERRLRQRLQRGQADVQGVVDLHGMRQAEAHHALHNFLRQAQANGARVVLIITGKGTSETEVDPFGQRGILRRSVPHWLRAPDLRPLVIGFEQASVAHGGAGALYVRIRRPSGSGSNEQ
jgi:DNA-nicking Smr family endonuclease